MVSQYEHNACLNSVKCSSQKKKYLLAVCSLFWNIFGLANKIKVNAVDIIPPPTKLFLEVFILL